MSSVVTVLIRTYNSSATVQRALSSVIHQTLDLNKISILVVDDGSTDDSITIVKENPNVKILQSNHQGSIPALNIGLKRVDTPYVTLLDSDDWFEPTILESMYTLFKEYPDTDFVYSDYYEVIDEVKKIVAVGTNIFLTVAAGIMFSTNLIRSLGYYDESLIFPEYDILIKMLPTAKRKYIAEPLYNYFRRKDSITSDKSLIERGKKELFEKYGEQYPIRDY